MRFGGDQPIHVAAARAAEVARRDRAERARETFYAMLHDEASDGGAIFEMSDCVRGAIETATRVRVTAEVVEAASAAGGYGGDIAVDCYRAMLAAAFAAAGFEVEE